MHQIYFSDLPRKFFCLSLCLSTLSLLQYPKRGHWIEIIPEAEAQSGWRGIHVSWWKKHLCDDWPNRLFEEKGDLIGYLSQVAR